VIYYLFSVQVQSSWAGYNDYNTLDQNAIIGAHPVISNLVFANGFSGHGIQHSPAVGRAVSEVILDGRSHTIDLSVFSFERIIHNRPLKEKNVV
jgi:FAD-dependent oxidoreductase domain-containing protein 1